MSTKTTVAILRTTPETVLDDYQRLFHLAGGAQALQPGRIGLGPFRVSAVVWDGLVIEEVGNGLLRAELDKRFYFLRRPSKPSAVKQVCCLLELPLAARKRF